MTAKQANDIIIRAKQHRERTSDRLITWKDLDDRIINDNAVKELLAVCEAKWSAD